VTLTLVEPVTAAVAAVTVLGERLQWYGWVGMALVVIGLAIAGRDPERTDSNPTPSSPSPPDRKRVREFGSMPASSGAFQRARGGDRMPDC